jgi:hypothetical protein
MIGVIGTRAKPHECFLRCESEILLSYVHEHFEFRCNQFSKSIFKTKYHSMFASAGRTSTYVFRIFSLATLLFAGGVWGGVDTNSDSNSDTNPRTTNSDSDSSKMASVSNLIPGYCRKSLRDFKFLYGTAWKKTRTTELVTKALAAGFTGVDTACQPKHYQEPLVGDALYNAFKAGEVKREDVRVNRNYVN